MKSEEARLPSATRAAANPAISTATATSPHPLRNSRSVNGGGEVTCGTAVTGLVRDGMTERRGTKPVTAALGHAVADPYDDRQFSRLVGDQEQFVGMGRVRVLGDRAAAGRPRHHLAGA